MSCDADERRSQRALMLQAQSAGALGARLPGLIEAKQIECLFGWSGSVAVYSAAFGAL